MASTSSPQTEEHFPYPLGANVADSVTLRLCATNYFAWKQLMLRFLESHKLDGFVNGAINLPEKPDPLWESSLWIEERRLEEQEEDWNQQHMQQEGKTPVDWVQEQERKQKRREGEWEESLEDQERRQEWLRRKEWGRERELWMERMLERKEKERKEREEHRKYMLWKRSDDLVRGWIVATMREELLPRVMYLVTAQEIQIQHLELHRAILTSDWDATKKFLDLNIHPDAVLQPITWCSETALIVAVRSAKRNNIVNNLLSKIMLLTTEERLELLDHQDVSGATALHAAVDGGNIDAAKRLVTLDPELVNIKDKYGTLAVHVAAELGNREMVNFLLDHHTTSLSETESGFKLLHSLASSGLYVIPLKSEDIANQPQRSYINCTVEPHQRSDIESIVEPVVSSSISVRQMLKALFWDVAEKLVAPIKSVRETKLLHYQALNLVKRLYYSVEETDLLNAAEILIEPLRNATCVGIHEIVEEILESFPSAIHLKSETDQSLFHLAIVYRQENVFNLIYQMEEDQRAILSMPDASTNNALHLAGNLTPQQQLLLRASAPGAALQMQRELQWFEVIL
ncbi:hypothetical protein C3L33_19508, partial [Rhododendron williamsianum]